MDVNETLRFLRERTELWLSGALGDQIAEDDMTAIAEHFEALDGWLSRGGFLPNGWKR